MNWKELIGQFSVVFWHYPCRAGDVAFRKDKGKILAYDDVTPGSKGEGAMLDAAKAQGADILIGLHTTADGCAERGLQLIVQVGTSPNDPADPGGDVHWGEPCVGEGSPYGNIAQIAWYEKHFGDRCLGYLLNESCKPCPENVVAARWLLNNAPSKLRYVSYGEPGSQNSRLFPVASFLDDSVSRPEHDRSWQDRFVSVLAGARTMARRQGCKLWWPMIPCRGLSQDDMAFQIDSVRKDGADGVVLFAWTPRPLRPVAAGIGDVVASLKSRK